MQQTQSPYQIAMLQMDCDLFHVSNNLDKAEKQIREAAAHGAKLICQRYLMSAISAPASQI